MIACLARVELEVYVSERNVFPALKLVSICFVRRKADILLRKLFCGVFLQLYAWDRRSMYM